MGVNKKQKKTTPHLCVRRVARNVYVQDALLGHDNTGSPVR